MIIDVGSCEVAENTAQASSVLLSVNNTSLFTCKNGHIFAYIWFT